MARCLPYFDGTIMVLNIIIFFAQHMAFWIVAPKASKAEIFLHFENRGGWSSEGAATVVGLITAASALVGIDAPAHLAEEVSRLTVVHHTLMAMARSNCTDTKSRRSKSLQETCPR